MNTFLLYWNPYFSSYKIDMCLEEFDFKKDVLTGKDWKSMPDNFNWSVFEHDKAEDGDRFFFIRTGYEKPTGLVGAGYFTSDPYKGDDWSGQGRETYYMDMDFDAIINPTCSKVLSTEELTEKIPEIVWSRGKAGTLVSPQIAAKIEALWAAHLESLGVKTLKDD